MKRRLLVCLVMGMMIFGGAGGVMVGEVGAEETKTGSEASAKEDCEGYRFMGFRPWYAGLTKYKNGKCNVEMTTKSNGKADVPKFVWTIVLNVLYDLSMGAGLVATGFVILGGYWYLRSGGDPVLVARGQKTLIAAVIGLGITLAAAFISNAVVTILTSR